MFQQKIDRLTVITAITIACLVLMVANAFSSVPPPGPGGDIVCYAAVASPGTGGGSSPARRALDAVSTRSAEDELSLRWIEFENALPLPFSARRIAIERLAERTGGDDTGKLPKDLRGPALFLAGEIRYLLGDYASASSLLSRSAGRMKDGPIEDDAEFAAISAIEAAGRDGEAADAWRKWLKKYPASPLAPRARLSLAWNRIRGGSFDEAAGEAASIESCFPWMRSDFRFILTVAAVDYFGGRYADASRRLEGAGDGAPAQFLRALCLSARGKDFEAAVLFQKLVDDHPESLLRGYALLAKGNIFSDGGDYGKAAAEFALISKRSGRSDIRGEAELLEAACVFLSGDEVTGTGLAEDVAARYAGSKLAARSRFMLGEMRWRQGRYEDAVVQYNKVLSDYFEDDLAGRALYRTARCFDALGRFAEANSTYQAVAKGYPYLPEAPAAIYLAGVGLMEQGKFAAAAPWFQLVLDRYSGEGGGETYTFESPEHQDLVEKSLCLLEHSYHQAGDMGRLSGAPHLVLQKMPPSGSVWRAYALLLDADALAATGRLIESQETLAKLFAEFPDHPVGVKANRLLAWTYARQGRQDLAIETEERMLARYEAQEDLENMSEALLTQAHALFNRKMYEEAALKYGEFLRGFPGHGKGLTALYQAGLCYQRLGREGDAVDRWEEVTAAAPAGPVSAKAWLRAGDLYFNTGHYDDARRCYTGFLDNFDDEGSTAEGLVRLARCDYNEELDAEALDRFKEVARRFPGTRAGREAETAIAQILFRMGSSDPEGGYLTELAESYPDDPLAPDARFAIAMKIYEEGRFEEAASEFKKVYTGYPASSSADRAFFLMADSYSRAGMKDSERGAWEDFLEYFPASELYPGALFRIASIRFDDGEYIRAASDFAAVLERETDEETRSASIFNLAMSYRILGRNGEAGEVLEGCRRGGAAGGREAEIAGLLGEIRAEEGNHAAAAREFETAIAADSKGAKTAELNYRLGECREKLGDIEGAIAAYGASMKAADLSDPFRLSAVARKAALHEQKGNLRGALTAYRDLIENADDPELALAARERAAQLEEVLK